LRLADGLLAGLFLRPLSPDVWAKKVGLVCAAQPQTLDERADDCGIGAGVVHATEGFCSAEEKYRPALARVVLR
jgi:hypothetical protein